MACTWPERQNGDSQVKKMKILKAVIFATKSIVSGTGADAEIDGEFNGVIFIFLCDMLL